MLQELIVSEEVVVCVHAMAANRRQHFIEHSCFELLCCREFGGDDEAVEVTFGNEADLLDSASGLKGVTKWNPLAMVLDRLAGVNVTERSGDVLSAEKDLAIVGECLNLVSHGGVLSRDPVEKKSCRAAQGLRASPHCRRT
ncbi:hypothetical protein ACQX3E_07440 [Corynebacterium diphtheriae]